MSEIFNAQDLSWSINNKLILDRLNFVVSENEFVGLIGPNGAGKSSLIRCLYRKTDVSSGSLSFISKPIASYNRREFAQKVAVVLQEPLTELELSVYEIIRAGLTPHKSLLAFDDQNDHEQILQAAKRVDLSNHLHQAFSSLSGGEKQRAMIARSLVQKPKVLLLDEPTHHLDVRHQAEVLQLAKSLNKTLVVSIHDLNLAAAYCDRLILLNEGSIVASGRPKDVLTTDNLKQVFGVESIIDQHPFHGGLRITFNQGDSSV
ncbi:MAG: ABC transporter ATP-binding protein [Kangiellaceae bacterium]|jgi:iron complex transport system ATP-binding protein|nr:ABC transporter ATP-binding protein [Kangiellaceae bacterium]